MGQEPRAAMTKIGEPWTPRRHSMKISPAYRVLPLYARRVLDAIEIELENHAGKDNGRLIVPYITLGPYCCTANDRILAQAIRELEILGFITVIHVHAKGPEYAPNMFGLTYAPGHDGSPPTDGWKEITSRRSTRTSRRSQKEATAKQLVQGRTKRRRNPSIEKPPGRAARH
jgi:hypothetical protein